MKKLGDKILCVILWCTFFIPLVLELIYVIYRATKKGLEHDRRLSDIDGRKPVGRDTDGREL